MSWIVPIAVFAFGVHMGISVFEMLRGRTAIGGSTLYRQAAPMPFWATLGFYLAGAAILVLLSIKLEAQREHCDPTTESCVMLVLEEPVA